MTDEPFCKRLRDHLDAGLGEVPDEVARRLRQARATAVAGGKRRFDGYWKPAAALVLAGLLLMALFLRPPREEAVLPDTVAVTDLELIAADDSLQFYDDLDFYQWLLSVERNSDAG